MEEPATIVECEETYQHTSHYVDGVSSASAMRARRGARAIYHSKGLIKTSESRREILLQAHSKCKKYFEMSGTRIKSIS